MVTNSLFQRTVIWKVVQNMLPGKKKNQNSGESTPSGIMWSFAAGSNLATSTRSAEKESRKNLNKFYKELRTMKTVNMAGNSRELKFEYIGTKCWVQTPTPYGGAIIIPHLLIRPPFRGRGSVFSSRKLSL